MKWVASNALYRQALSVIHGDDNEITADVMPRRALHLAFARVCDMQHPQQDQLSVRMMESMYIKTVISAEGPRQKASAKCRCQAELKAAR